MSALRIFIPLLLFGCSTSWGCSSPTRPEDNGKYASIVLGEVIGIRLTDYANARERQIRDGSAYAWGSDASPGYEVEVISFEILKGPARDRLQLKIPLGCAIPRPDLNQFGIFYIDAQGHAVPVYQNDEEYRSRLVALGSKYTASCAGVERSTPHPCWKPRQHLLECLEFVHNVAAASPSSCPAGEQELRERLRSVVVGPYGWKIHPSAPVDSQVGER